MTEAKPSAGIVRAWFDSVLNPLHDGLRNELRHLERGDLAWRFRERRSVVIQFYRELINPREEPNLDQFLEHEPDLSSELASYDVQVGTLNDCLNTYHAALLNDITFRELLDKYLAEASDPRLAPRAVRQELPDALAEYVINNIRQLSDIYSTASFWNVHSKEFLACRNRPGLRTYREATEEAAVHLSKIVRLLVSHLRSRRSDLSYEYGVPIVK
jgi:hypothetical protein